MKRWPTTAAGWHEHFKKLDADYGTEERSPLHHDNRCPLCNPFHIKQWIKNHPSAIADTSESERTMNATDFGVFNHRDYNHGICMWSPDNEWCAKPTVVENHSRIGLPTEYRFGNLYGIDMPNGLPTHMTMWVCEAHRLDFLKLNGKGEYGSSVWQFDHNGQGTKVKAPAPLREVSVRIRTEMSSEFLSATIKSQLNAWMRENEQIEGWSYLKVVEVS